VKTTRQDRETKSRNPSENQRTREYKGGPVAQKKQRRWERSDNDLKSSQQKTGKDEKGAHNPWKVGKKHIQGWRQCSTTNLQIARKGQTKEARVNEVSRQIGKRITPGGTETSSDPKNLGQDREREILCRVISGTYYSVKSWRGPGGGHKGAPSGWARERKRRPCGWLKT